MNEIKQFGVKLGEENSNLLTRVIMYEYEEIRLESNESLPDFEDLTEREKILIFNISKELLERTVAVIHKDKK